MDGRTLLGKTVTFAVIGVFMLVFIIVFGTAYALVGVVISTAALTMLSKDLSVRPFSNLASITAFMVFLGLGAYLASLDPYLGLVVNFAMVFLTVFLTMHDLTSPIYFPMLLCYTVLYTTPIGLGEMPDRLLLLAMSAVFIVGLNVLVNHGSRNRISHDGVASMCEEVNRCVTERLEGGAPDSSELEALCSKLNRSMYDRLKSHFFTTPRDRTVLDLVISILDLGKAVCDRDIHPDTLRGIHVVMDVLISHENGEASASDVAEAVDDFLSGNPDADYALTSAMRSISSEVRSLASDSGDDYPYARSIGVVGILRVIREEARRDSARFTFSVRMGLMFALAGFAWTYWEWDNAQWILYTIIAAVVPYLEDSWRLSLMRLTGTLAGTCVFVLVSLLIGGDPVAEAGVAMLAGYAYVVLDHGRHDQRMFFYTLLVLLASSMVTTSDTLAIDRILFTLAGIAVAMVANRVIMPYRISDENLELAGRSMAICLERIHNIREALDGDTDRVEDAGLTIISASISQKMRTNTERSPDPLASRFQNSQDSLTIQCSSLGKAVPTMSVRCRESVRDVLDAYSRGKPDRFEPDLDGLDRDEADQVKKAVWIMETYIADRRLMYDMIVSRYAGPAVCEDLPSYR